jgi:hypothetical protein
MTMLKIQYPRAIRMPSPAMIGRITKGGLVKRSKVLILAATGVGLGESVGLAVGDGEVSGDGDGESVGVGLAAAACSVKLAQGLGGTLAHSRWTPGGSPGYGLTLVVKFPFASALAAPDTLPGWSQ